MAFNPDGNIAILQMSKIEVKKGKEKLLRVVVVARLVIGKGQMLRGVDWLLSSDYSFLAMVATVDQVRIFDFTVSDEDKEDFRKQIDTEGS